MSDFRILNRNDYSHVEEQPSYGIWLILLLLNLLAGFYHSSKAILLEAQVLDVWSGSYYAITLILTSVALFNFWKRKRITPWLLIAYLTVNLAYAVILDYNGLLGGGEIHPFYLLRNAIVCLLAIPYLLLSKHVKTVFVQ